MDSGPYLALFLHNFVDFGELPREIPKSLIILWKYIALSPFTIIGLNAFCDFDYDW